MSEKLAKIDLKNIPKPFSEAALKLNVDKFSEKNPELVKKLNTPIIRQITDSIFGNSPYLSDIIIKKPRAYLGLFENGFEDSFHTLIDEVNEFKAKSADELMVFLREIKHDASLLIAIAEITKLWKIEKTTENLSLFADYCVYKTCEFLLSDYHNKQFIKLKYPNEPFRNSGLAVISLGKLGSFELNYSSDIDLCVFYDDEKLEYLGRKSLAQFYIDLAQDMTKILSERTKDGYVFRVDMRLRPDPGSNPLAVSIKKAEKYYFTVGQNWERAAYTKARFVCGDKRTGAAFNEFMKRNVWRKSLDFETIEDIHSIKRQIDTKQGIHPNNLYGYNVKLGHGGIREIEFYAQTQQLIWGGKKPVLREKKTPDALYALAGSGEISIKIADELTEAYWFYRMVEHRLQMVNDEQTHTLPKDEGQMGHIAVFCGFRNSKDFLTALHSRINLVNGYYSKLFETSPSLASDFQGAQGSLIFTGTENHPDTIATLAKMGFKEPNRVSDIVRGWHHGRISVTTKKRARAELTKLMPALFTAFAKSPNPDIAFIHFDEFLGKMTETSQIFSLLLVNHDVLELLAEVMGGYPELADTLSKNPLLIEYVVSSEFYKTLPDIDELQESLDKEIREAKGDLEESIEVIKNFANDRKFRIGVQLVRDGIAAEKVFLGLSNIAETVVRATLQLVAKDLEKNVGVIEGGKLGIIAFGKLGSRELTFNSDLDLVFIYDFKKENPKISASSYYTKMVSQIVSILSTLGSSGKLYDVDSRLRPLGDKGPLATSLKSFDEYYNPAKKEGSAWAFEYIALTRARAIAIDEKFESKIQRLIKEKLSHEWNDEELHREALYIYDKFRKTKKQKNALDIKNARGGLFDLEFMIRFLQLKNLYEMPNIFGQSSIKTINALHKGGIFNKADFEVVKKAYALYKDIQNILRITSETAVSGYTEKIICETLKLRNPAQLYSEIEITEAKINRLFKKYLEI